MKRLTVDNWRNLDPWECCGQDRYCIRPSNKQAGCRNGCIVPKLYDRLAQYEDTGFSPEEIKKERWIPCSERLPEDGQYVLCWYQYFRYGNYNRLWQTYGIGFQYNGNWGGEVSTGRDTKVLFWMPLPNLPEEGQK